MRVYAIESDMSNEKWPTWLVSYGYEGSKWEMKIVAKDMDDAKRRLSAAAAWGVVDGELIAEIPVWRGGFLVPLVCRVRNFFRREGGATPG